MMASLGRTVMRLLSSLMSSISSGFSRTNSTVRISFHPLRGTAALASHGGGAALRRAELLQAAPFCIIGDSEPGGGANCRCRMTPNTTAGSTMAAPARA